MNLSVVDSEEIDRLVEEEKKLRSELRKLEKEKHTIAERRCVVLDIERCVKKQLFLKALAKLELGMTVSSCTKHPKTGVVTGFQTYAGRTVAAWVRWNGSNVPMPEEPTMLTVARK